MGLFSGGGFFGSGGKTNSGNTTNDTKSSIANMDFSDAKGMISNINLGTTTDSDISITATDHGAVNGGLDIARTALDNIAGISAKFADDNASLAAQAAKNGSEKTLTSSTYLIGTVLAGAGILLFAMRAKK